MSLKELCRACLRSGQTLCSSLDSIVEKIDSPPNSVVCLWKFFSKMLITTEDIYPDKICTDCLVEFQRTYSFMRKCERSENVLKRMKSVEIRLKRLGSVSPVRELDISKKIKFEKEMCPNIAQIRNENIEWNSSKIGYDKEDTEGGQFQVIIHANGQGDPRAQHTFIVQHENDNFEIKLLDHFNAQNDTNDEVFDIQGIKNEYELDLRTGNVEFDQVESEDQADTEILSCPGCYYQCSMLANLEKHIIENHMEGQLCKLCSQDFELSTVEHSSKSLKSSNRNLSYHVKWHTGERPFKCESCPKTFLRKHHLMEHMPYHTGERFRCEICPKAYMRKRELGYHIRDCHT